MSERAVVPWSLLCDEARGRPRCLIVDAKGNEIAAVNPFRESWNENANLLKAAPELLEALEDCEFILYGCGLGPKAQEKARAAIKKARGE